MLPSGRGEAVARSGGGGGSGSGGGSEWRGRGSSGDGQLPTPQRVSEVERVCGRRKTQSRVAAWR